MQYFLQGLTMGLAYVAPIGLQNLFVINSALTHTRRYALLTALIVIFFDVSLAFACFFGIGAVMQRYKWLQMIILFVGSIIVIFIGIGLLRAKTEELDHSDSTLSIQKTISNNSFFFIVVLLQFSIKFCFSGCLFLITNSKLVISVGKRRGFSRRL